MEEAAHIIISVPCLSHVEKYVDVLLASEAHQVWPRLPRAELNAMFTTPNLISVERIVQSVSCSLVQCGEDADSYIEDYGH
jgi:hypothetical protein